MPFSSSPGRRPRRGNAGPITTTNSTGARHDTPSSDIAGVNDYSGQANLPPGWSVGNLNRSLDDAGAMYTLLSENFGATVTASLTDGAATRDAILSAINDMLAVSDAGDVATFFFSGHGGRLPADALKPAALLLNASSTASGAPITDLDLHGLSDSLEPSYVNFTVILDSCNSGGIPMRALPMNR